MFEDQHNKSWFAPWVMMAARMTAVQTLGFPEASGLPMLAVAGAPRGSEIRVR